MGNAKTAGEGTRNKGSTRYARAVLLLLAGYLSVVSCQEKPDNTWMLALALSGAGSGASAMASVAEPKFSVPDGTYPYDLTVTISSATPGATLYFTTDGSPPDATSTKYSSPVTVPYSGNPITIRAIAMATGKRPSPVTTATYTIRPALIYELKDGSIPLGSAVRLQNQLVTARSAKEYYLQIKEGDPDWQGSADHSGIYVYSPANAVSPGDRVTITGANLVVYFGQRQLMAGSVVVEATGQALPSPLVVDPGDVATGGSRASSLESVLITVTGVSVTSISPPAKGGDTMPNNEFVVTGGLRVNDSLYLINPFPSVGQSYSSLTGILEFRNSDSKLELRRAADVVP